MKSLSILKMKTIAEILDDELARAAQESIPATELLERLLTTETEG